MSTQYISWPPPRTASGVTSLNSESGDLNIVAGTGISVVPAGTNITINATGAEPLPDGTVLSGTYPGSVIVAGSASLGADVSILGDLFIQTNLTNTGGFALSVKGDCFIGSVFSFTPLSTATPQSNVTIGGAFIFGTTSDFRVNPGQSPSLTADSMSSYNSFFDGSGQLEANGLTINLLQDFSGISLDLNGGDSNNTANAGNGGSLTCLNFKNGSGTAEGGNSSHAGFAPGAGGSFIVNANGSTSNLTADGGNATAGTQNGGVGGDILFGGDVTNTSQSGNPVPLTANGGSSLGGTGGSGGFINFNTGSFLSVQLSGGNSTFGAGGAAGTLGVGVSGNSQMVQLNNSLLIAFGGDGGTDGGSGQGNNPIGGDCTLLGFDVHGGAGGSGNGGTAGSFQFFGSVTALGDMNLNGGNGNGVSGTGGDGGTLTIKGFLVQNGSVNVSGGTGNVPGSAGSNTVNGTPVAHGVTGGGSALLGANCPAVTVTTPFTWMKFKAEDGSIIYVPAWK